MNIPDPVLLVPLTTMSPNYQSHFGTSGRTSGPISSRQKSVYNSFGSHLPAKIPIHLHPYTRSRNKTVHPDHRKQVTIFTGRRHLSNPTPPLIRAPVMSIAPPDLTKFPVTSHSLARHGLFPGCFEQKSYFLHSRGPYRPRTGPVKF